MSRVQKTILSLLCALLQVPCAIASPLTCERIKDHDQRHLCRAETTGKKTWCAYIKDSDIRARCYAIVDKDKKK